MALVGGYTRAGFSFSNAAAATLGTSYQYIELKADATNAPRAANVPVACHIDSVTFEITVTSGSPATLTFYLSRDSGGDYPLTPEGTAAIITGKTTAAKRGTAVMIGRDYLNPKISGIDVDDTLYVQLKLSSGAGTVKTYLTWKA